jgi:hypothetical protein
MGFRFIKHTFEDGQVIEATKVVENMKIFAHEINGNLDRENLPLDAITNAHTQCEDGCFNEVYFQRIGLKGDDVTTAWGPSGSGAATKLSFKDFNVQYYTICERTVEVPVDSLIIVHFGCVYEWFADPDAAEAVLAGLSTSWNNHALDLGSSALITTYDNIGEFFVDFRLRINGEVVCLAPQFSFIRRRNSVSMNGVLPVAAGKSEILVEAKQYRLVSAGPGRKEIVKKSKAFYITVSAGWGNLITQIKKR